MLNSEPGRYVIVPSTLESNMKGDFYILVFLKGKSLLRY